MIQINSKSDLNRAVANALHPEPATQSWKFWAIHESGVWRWVGYFPNWCDVCRLKRAPCESHITPAHCGVEFELLENWDQR